MNAQIEYKFEVLWHGHLITETRSAELHTDIKDIVKALWGEGLTDVKLLRKEWPRWAWPGGYPIYYLTADNGVLCSKCANDNVELTSDRDGDDQWRIVYADINYEDSSLYCEHCGELVESAYGEPEQ
jgi:hypothetical protein